MKGDKLLTRALELLGEIDSQDFVTEAMWDSAEARRWRRKTRKLLKECGYVDTTTDTALTLQ